MKNIQNSSLPDLDGLRPYLDIPTYNTGRSRPLTTPSGIIIDDIEELHALTDEHGYMILQSGIEFPFYAYRGQPREHVPCMSTLGRLKRPEEQLLAICRNVAFEDALKEYPFIRICRHSSFSGRPLRVDVQGLAQHYGLATNLLDFTSNFDVASFFAVCYWDNEAFEYRPVVDSEEPGVIYRIIPNRFFGANLGADLEIIGWQPLKRPEQQRAFGLKMKKGKSLEMLPVQMVKFRHSAEISKRIWKFFDEGRSLFPDDEAGALAQRAATICQFTRQQIDRAWKRLDSWNDYGTTTCHRIAVEGKSEIQLTKTSILNWESFEIERDEGKLVSQLGEILSKVSRRLCIYPE